MEQAVGAGEDLDEGAEIDQPDHLAQIGLPHLGHGRDVGDHLQRLGGGGFVGRADVNRTVVLDVDLAAGLLDDAADHLAARTDQLADLVGGNGHGVNAGRVGRKVRARRREHLFHLAENEEAALERLVKRLAHDRGGHVGHLDVHLEGGNALARAGDLEVHVAVVVLGAGDVGKHRVAVSFDHQPHGYAGHRRREGHAGVHQRQSGAADGGHRTGAVGLQNVAHHAHGVRESGVRGDYRGESALGECAVADLPAARAAHESNLAHAEGREIVVHHEALGSLAAFQQLQALFVVLRAQGHRD